MSKKNNKTYSHEQIKLEVNIVDDTPFLNVFLEDGGWFPLRAENVRVTKGSQCHPEVYRRVWGKPMPTISSIKYAGERKP